MSVMFIKTRDGRFRLISAIFRAGRKWRRFRGRNDCNINLKVGNIIGAHFIRRERKYPTGASNSGAIERGAREHM